MYCAECDKTMSTVDIVKNSFKRWRDTVFSNERTQHNRPDTNIPLSSVRLDMAAYTFSYHMNGGCALEKDCFGGNMHVWETLLKHRFEEQHHVTVDPASKKVANVDFCFLLCLHYVHTSMKIKETTTRTRLCGTHWMDQLTLCTPFKFSPKDQWDVST
jgi:hypothetical protein